MTEPSCHSRLSSKQLTRHPISDWFDHAVFRRMCSCEARVHVNKRRPRRGLDTPAAGARDARRHLELVDVREYEAALVAHEPVLRVSSPLLRQRRVPKALEMHRVGHMRAAQPVSARDLRVGARCYV